MLQQQTDFAYEVVVCDDASTDDTATVIKALATDYDHLRPVYKTKNEGLSKNIATLLQAARGEYIAYLDGDDLALPNKLQCQVDYLERTPDCQMVFHESDMFDSGSGQSLRRYSQDYYNWSYIPSRSGLEHLVRYGTYMQASSVMFRNHPNLLQAVPRGYQIILDYPFYIANAGFLAAAIDFIPDCLGRYRVHPNSFGGQTQRNTSRRLQCCDDMVKACQAAEQFGLSQEIISAGIAQHRYAAALFFLFRGEDGLFTECIEKSAIGEYFFDDRHRLAWSLREQPIVAREQLQS